MSYSYELKRALLDTTSYLYAAGAASDILFIPYAAGAAIRHSEALLFIRAQESSRLSISCAKQASYSKVC